MPKANRTIHSDAVVIKVRIDNDHGEIPPWMIQGRIGSLAEQLNLKRRKQGEPPLTDADREKLEDSIDRSGWTDISLDGALLTALWLLAPNVEQEGDKTSIKRDVVDLVEAAAFEVAWSETLGRSSFSRAVQARLVAMIAELGGADPDKFRQTIQDFRGGNWKFFQRRSYNQRLAAHETCALRRAVVLTNTNSSKPSSSPRRSL